jgi:UDP-N-acetylglucosamine 3-dehydrogenase
MLKVAILGLGFMGKLHAQVYARMPHVQLIAVGGCRRERFENWCSPCHVDFYANSDALLAAGADVLDVCLPTFLHEEFVVRAAERGIHILCEKPLALTISEVDRMLTAVNRAGVTLMVGQVLRFFPQYSKCRELVQNGTLGDPLCAYASRLSYPPKWADWFRDPQKSGGALFDLQVHDVDYIISLFGMPESIYACGFQSPSGAWDQVTSLLLYPGKSACIEASYRMPTSWPFTSTLRAVGTRAVLECKFRVCTNVEDARKAERTLVVYPNEGPPICPQLDDLDPFFAELSYFVDVISRGEKPNEVPVEEARQVIACLEMVKESLETHNVVYVSRRSAMP